MNAINEQTKHFMKTFGFTWTEQPDHLLACHLETKVTIRVDSGDTPQEIVTKLVRQARKFP